MEAVERNTEQFRAEVEERLRQSAERVETSRALIDETSACLSRTRDAVTSSRIRLKPLSFATTSYSHILDGVPLDFDDPWQCVAGAGEPGLQG